MEASPKRKASGKRGTVWKASAQAGVSVDEAFLVPVDERLEAVITVSTAFERIAKYAEVQTQLNESLDSAFVQSVANEPLFVEQYALDIVSPHKAISIVRYVLTKDRGQLRPDAYTQMKVQHRASLGRGLYRQIVSFPYVYPFPYDWHNFEEVSKFEAVVYRFPMMPKIAVDFSVGLYKFFKRPSATVGVRLVLLASSVCYNNAIAIHARSPKAKQLLPGK